MIDGNKNSKGTVMKLQQIITEIYNKIEELKNDVKNINQEFTYCFRGEAKDYGATKLMPTLFRENMAGDKLRDRELISLISDYKIADSSFSDSLSKAIEGQHFLAMSRLLDITFSMLPSIFFASLYEKNEDGIIYIFQFPKTYSPSSVYINNYYEKLINGEINPFYQNFKVLSHTQSNERIKSQSGGFILFPGSEVKKIPKEYYRKVIIKSEIKNIIIDELDSFFNINESIIYPEKDKKRDLIHKKLQMITNEKKYNETSVEFYISEINEAIDRIKYEYSIFISQIESKKEAKYTFKRRLRKEKQEIIDYITSLDSNILSEEWKDEQKDRVKSEYKKWISLL